MQSTEESNPEVAWAKLAALVEGARIPAVNYGRLEGGGSLSLRTRSAPSPIGFSGRCFPEMEVDSRRFITR